MYLGLGITILAGIAGICGYSYKNSVKTCINNALFGIFLAYTNCHFYCHECMMHLTPIVNKLFRNNDTDIIIIYKNDKVLTFSVKNNPSDIPDDPEMILYGHLKKNKESKYYYMQRINYIPSSPPKYTASKTLFFAANIRILEKGNIWASYPLSLDQQHSTDVYNYIVTENKIFDEVFVKYWLINFFSIKLTQEQQYDVHFLDAKFNNVKISPHEHIKITDSDYNIASDTIDTQPEEV